LNDLRKLFLSIRMKNSTLFPPSVIKEQLQIKPLLRPFLQAQRIEAGCDEAGRGCLAGSVFAAGVILPPDFWDNGLKDSKQMTEKQRLKLRQTIQQNAISWHIGIASAQEIDKMNIAQASYLAMHRAIEGLKVLPECLLIDGKYFNPFADVPHVCIIKGDAKFMAIAAASVLAKTYRDEYIMQLADEYPQYHWEQNKGYPTQAHREAIARFGLTEHHRLSFRHKL
jgi:ribonuclease HII